MVVRDADVAKCVTMPSCPPLTVQRRMLEGSRSKPNEMSIPWAYSPPGSSTAQSLMLTLLRLTLIPSRVAP